MSLIPGMDAAKFALIIGSGVALMVAGAAAWDQMPVVGPHAKIVGLRAGLDEQKALVATRTGEREAWRTAAGTCEATRKAELQNAADKIVADEATKGQTADRSFDQGYAAGRAVGRKSCEVPDAKDPLPNPGGVAGHDGVSDDSVRAWNATRYQPGAVPR